MGWDIPELLQQYELSSHVMFTYICPETNKPFPSRFRGAITVSPFTQKFNATLSSVKHGLSYKDLSSIINLFDLYVQYANCEGFGLPQVEAAACAIPVAGTDYSAMESVLRQLDGIPITPKSLYKELETGCFRAVPDNDLAAQKFYDFFQQPKNIRRRMGYRTRELFLKHFQWDISGNMWEKYFDSVELKQDSETWLSPPRIYHPQPKPQDIPQNMSHDQLAAWLIGNVLGEPEKINSFMQARLVRDLMYGCSTQMTGGMYFNESSANFDTKNTRVPFNFDIAYNHMLALCNRRNAWEQKRAEVFNIS